MPLSIFIDTATKREQSHNLFLKENWEFEQNLDFYY
ncbi:hypothetical protein N405_06940 [Helicobacter pylori FD568]|nr:hypothetical protein N405_06940 [Helicobacter pylori FD568]